MLLLVADPLNLLRLRDEEFLDSAAQDDADDVEVVEFAGSPDHSPDIFPALIFRSCSASIRWSSLAFQMPRLAAASRRFHLIV
jgi:hypothetical protein